jgi:Transcriptional regulators
MAVEQHPIAKDLMEAFMQMGRYAMKDGRGKHGYRRSQIMVLYCLKDAESLGGPGLMVSEISRRLNVTSPTVTQLINELEVRGFVERKVDARDRRAVRILLTDKGRALIDRTTEAFLDSFNGLVEHLGEEESKQLAHLLKKASAYLLKSHLQLDQYILTDGDGEV